MKFSFTSFFALIALASALPEASAQIVNPTPQQMTVTGETRVFFSKNAVVREQKEDADCIRILNTLREKSPPADAAGTLKEIIIGERDNATLRDFAKDIPAKSGAYKIAVSRERIRIAGHDARGTFYALQTLRQLIDPATGTLPVVEILDAPDIAERGVVEGFYGTPWTHENRLAQFEFYGRNKMNTYIYGPKDDPYHRAPNWRKPYPPADAARIAELVRAAAANKVDFVWAIHPGGDIKWIEADFLAAREKFEAMYTLGVRAFAVFFDDIGGEGTKADKQAEFLNRLHSEFILKKPDVAPLIMCPTEYNRSWSNPKSGGYLDILGEHLDPSIRVMWTGNRVIADIDKPTLDWVNSRLRRKAYIWWNFPVSDYVRNHLLMGPAYGNTADIGDMTSGFLSNPMERAEASKVALYGVSGYAWNLRAYDAEQSWENAMREILPGAPAAFRTFCVHNSDLGANGHGYRREESVAIKPIAERFLEKLRQGEIETESFAALKKEFEKIARAPAEIRAAGDKDNPALIKEISPWLDAFEQLGTAGESALQALETNSAGDAWLAYAKAFSARERMRDISDNRNKNPFQPGVKTGSLVLEPLVAETLEIAGARLLEKLSGKPVVRCRPITNSDSKDGVERMFAGDEKNYYYSRQIQKPGDWFGVDLGAAVPVSEVSLLMGRHAGDHDIVHRGQLEYSANNKDWQPLGAETSSENIAWKGAPVQARQVRYRVTHAGKTDGSKNDVWCAIRSFQINDYCRQTSAAGAPQIYSSLKNLAQIPVTFSGNAYAITPQNEVFKLPAGQHVGVRFPSPVDCKKIEIDLAANNLEQRAELEISVDEKTWKKIPLAVGKDTGVSAEINAPACFVRLSNAGNGALDAKIISFRIIPQIGADGANATPFTDGRLDTAGTLAARQYVALPANVAGVALLFANGSGAEAKIGVASTPSGEPVPLGVSAGDFATFRIPAGAKFIVIEPRSAGARLHEIVATK